MSGLKFEMVTYSRSAVQECRESVMRMPWTVRLKYMHVGRCIDMGRLFDKCYERTGCMVFDKWNTVWEEYDRMVNYQEATKKELDRSYKECLKYLLEELDTILLMIERGEVNSVV